MRFSAALPTLASALAFINVGYAFDFDIFASSDCSGDALKEVNVYDNTCANWMGGFGSIRGKAYGASLQKGYFFKGGDCGDLITNAGTFYVDGSSSDFQVGQCHGFGNGNVINAVASYSS